MGIFSVGSAYHTQWLHKFGANELIQQAGSAGDERVWANLWKLKVPAKIKIFGWRVLHGLLPCRGILANRHIGNVSSCPVCQEGCEDIKHLLFSCNRAKEIWRLLGISDEVHRLLQVDRSGLVILAEVIRYPKKLAHLNKVDLAELILTGSWYLWWERRMMVHENTVQSPTRSAMSIVTLTMNYQKASASTKVRVGWKKPPEDFLMLNVDASYNPDRRMGSTGAVIRDHTGSFVIAGARFFENILDAPMAETLALREGIILAQQIGCSKLLIQSDCSEVVETMKQGGFSATSSAAIYEECVQLWQEFTSISIEHCNREINKVAHEIARVAFQSKLSCNWVDEPPSFILASLVNDGMLFEDQ